jgi:uncharacterized membrane protein YeiB
MLHTLGCAVAVVGAVLLLTRVQVVRRVLRPVADAGSMILTLYVGHLLVLATGVLDGHPSTQFACLLTALVTFAMIWRRFMDRGPLESLISAAAARLRGAVLDAHRPALPR